jgi:aldehyde dehydrogenase (NAD+)
VDRDIKEQLNFYIDGDWVGPEEANPIDVINPATEEPMGRVSLGSAADVDRAVRAAGDAFPGFSRTTREERVALLDRILEVYESRYEEIAETISLEMGAPLAFAREMQAAMGTEHFGQAREVLEAYDFEEDLGNTMVLKEPIGVCGLITPWNWPINQIACKVAPALAAGCPMILKPSEIAPLNACLLAEVLHEAGVPAGVFNLVNGDGPAAGAAIAAHPGIDMVSFTGSTQAGIEVARAAASTVKRVTQELGGKSANIILEDADLKPAVEDGVMRCFMNSGQSCNAPTRMLVPASREVEAVEIARAAAAQVKPGDPLSDTTDIGPVTSGAQFDKVQHLIKKGIAEGALLVAGGLGRPEGLEKGYYVRPTVFANVSNDMTVAREEIFGPVLTILAYESEDDAVAIANDTPYGLSASVHSGDPEHARKVARLLRSGEVHLNGAGSDIAAPFGGYKESGNGREWGVYGFEEFLEVKAILG